MASTILKPGDLVQRVSEGTKTWLWGEPWSGTTNASSDPIATNIPNDANLFVLAVLSGKGPRVVASTYQDVFVLLPNKRIGWMRSTDLEPT